MTLTAETGDGVSGAESYGTVAGGDAYWGKRTHLALYTTWNAASTAEKEGVLREATAFMDGTWGEHYRGTRAGYVQGLLWPRADAFDDAGYPLPGLPPEIVTATYELAARALSATLAPDADRAGAVKRVRRRVGPIEREFEYSASAPVEKRYGVVLGILAPVLDGRQYGAARQWAWA